MATEVILPKVDMDMATGRISRWLVPMKVVPLNSRMLYTTSDLCRILG